MISLTTTISLPELLWVAISTGTFVLCLVRFHNAMIDAAVALNRRARIIARRNVRSAAGRTWRQCVFALVGVRAMTQPPAVGTVASWTGAAIALAFISLAVFDLVDASFDIREQQLLLDWKPTRRALARIYPPDEETG
jgi:hypothetical protein